MNHVYQKIVENEFLNATSSALRQVQQNYSIKPTLETKNVVTQKPSLATVSKSNEIMLIEDQKRKAEYERQLKIQEEERRHQNTLQGSRPIMTEAPSSFQLQPESTSGGSVYDDIDSEENYSLPPSYGGGGGGGFIPPSMSGESDEEQYVDPGTISKSKRNLKPLIITAAVIGIGVLIFKPF